MKRQQWAKTRDETVKQLPFYIQLSTAPEGVRNNNFWHVVVFPVYISLPSSSHVALTLPRLGHGVLLGEDGITGTWGPRSLTICRTWTSFNPHMWRFLFVYGRVFLQVVIVPCKIQVILIDFYIFKSFPLDRVHCSPAHASNTAVTPPWNMSAQQSKAVRAFSEQAASI